MEKSGARPLRASSMSGLDTGRLHPSDSLMCGGGEVDSGWACLPAGLCCSPVHKGLLVLWQG